MRSIPSSYDALRALAAVVWMFLPPVLAAGPAFAQPSEESRSRFEPPEIGLPRKPVLRAFSPPPLQGRAVRGLSEDGRGFLWLTADGDLMRFDGHRARVFEADPEDPEKLPSRVVAALTTGHDGRLWIGTRGGLSYWDEAAERFWTASYDAEDPRSLSDNSVSELVVDRQGRVWAGTGRGLNRLDGTLEEGFERFVEHPGIDGSFINALLESRSGDVYAASGRGAVLRFGPGGDLETVFPYDGREVILISSLAEDEDGRIWIGSDRGLGLLRERSWSLQEVGGPAGEVAGSRIELLKAGQDGRVWVGPKSKGLYLLEPAASVLEAYEPMYDDPRPLFGSQVRDLLIDRSGATWIVDGEGRVSRAEPFSELLSFFSLESTGLSQEVRRICGDLAAGRGWLATEAGLIEIGDRPPAWVSTEPAFPDDSDAFSCLETSNGDLWVGFRRGPAVRRRGETRFERPAFMDIDRPVIQMLEGPGGRVVVASSRRISTFELGSDRLEDYAWEIPGGGSEGMTSRLIYLDRRGDLWAMPTVGGLFRARAGTRTLRFVSLGPESVDPSSSPAVLAVFEDPQGILWLATRNAGLLRLDPEGETVERLDRAGGLVSNYVFFVTGDDRGNLWLFTDRALCRWSPATGELEHRLFNYHNIVISAFAQGISIPGHGGDLLLPLGRYLGWLDLDRAGEIFRRTRTPEPVLSGMRTFNRPTPIREDGPLKQPAHLAQQVDLDYRDDVVTFELASLDYGDLFFRRYRYRLEGFDADWLDADPQLPLATYTNLDGGRYRLQAQVSADMGETWSPERTLVSVRVDPPPWRSAWAYGLYLLTVVGLVYLQLSRQRRKLLQEQKINRQLLEIDRLKDDFLAATSHELRTPLFGIAGLTESILERPRNLPLGEVATDLHAVLVSARRLSALVDDILDFSKIRRGGLELSTDAVDLHSVVDVVLTLNRPLLGDKPVELRNGVDDRLPPVIADVGRIEQILHNLVGNAVKFTAEGRIEVRAEPVGEELRVSVADTGTGIPPSKIEDIFRPFEQVSKAIEREHGGTGLGLAISRRLVELHGGDLTVESVPGEGSTFHFNLPIAGEAERREVPARPVFRSFSPLPGASTDRTASEHDAPPSSDSRVAAERGGGVILIVDDEPINRRVLVGYLSGLGHRVLWAPNGTEALQLLEDHPVDLVLLDIMMPKMSGYEVCRQIRRRWTMEELPVVFLTAKSQVEDRVAGFAEGGNDFLIKPVAREELLARVAKELELLSVHRHLHEEVQVLSGLLPICASCKNVRDDNGYWGQIETYISSRSEAEFSHGICPKCVSELYGDLLYSEIPEEDARSGE